jgi:hypothetical protein
MVEGWFREFGPESLYPTHFKIQTIQEKVKGNIQAAGKLKNLISIHLIRFTL